MTPDTEPDPVNASVAALIDHDATCGYCSANLNIPGAARCAERDALFAARRRALTGRAGEDGQITTTPATG